jgi:hypothetical protein
MKTKPTKGALAQARKDAADTIIGLKDGKVAPAIAEAIYKQNLTIIDSFRVELRGIELAHSISTGPVDYAQALALIEGKVEK